jgi:hypothetical protein
VCIVIEAVRRPTATVTGNAWGEDYWLKPGETITIIAVGAGGPLVWPGDTTSHAPFDE